MNLEIRYDLPDRIENYNLFESTDWNNEYKASPGLLLETLMNSSSVQKGKKSSTSNRVLGKDLLMRPAWSIKKIS
jgi:hypothetical protein